MVIFPGHEQAAFRFFQNYLQLLTDQSFSLSAVRELVAALADLNSYSHLSKLLKKDKQAVNLEMTDRFKSLLFDKHKLRLSEGHENALSFLLIDEMPLAMLPLPEVTLPDVGGHYGEWSPDLKFCLGNTVELADFVNRIQGCPTQSTPTEPRIVIDPSLIEEGCDLDEIIAEELIIRFQAENPTDVEAGEAEFNKSFDDWMKANGFSVNSLMRELQCYYRQEFFLSLTAGVPLVTTAQAIPVPADGSSPFAEMLDRVFGQRGTLITYQVCCATPDSDTSDARFNFAAQVTERYCFAVLYSNGQYIPVGSAKALSVCAETINDLLEIGDFHSAMGNDMGRAVASYAEKLSDDEHLDLYNDDADVVVATALLDVKLADDKKDELFEAWLLSQLCGETYPLPLTDQMASGLQPLSEFEKADVQCLPFVPLTGIALMLIEGPQPTSNVAFPHLAFAPTGSFNVEREAMTPDIAARMENDKAFAEVVRELLAPSTSLITYDPWDYPLS